MLPVVIAAVVVVLIALEAAEERVRVLLQLLADVGMVVQEILEARVVGEVPAARHERGGAAQIVRDAGMVAKEALELLEVAPADLAVATLRALEAMEPPQDRVRIAPQLVPDVRVVVEEVGEAAVIGDVPRIVHERGIAFEVPCDPGVIVEKTIEPPDGLR